MEVQLKNRSAYLTIVTLNSGKTIHLAPSEVSGAIDDLEVNGNRKVEKLVTTGKLSVQSTEHQHS
jgi:hypothetical protein